MIIETSARTTDLRQIVTPPPWMKIVLLSAGAYNLLWGAIAILFPMSSLTMLGIEGVRYPEFWQCIGMIVGVYGVGYAIAAYNPYRHWPIVLVGLLGKILGPIGFGSAVWNDRLPASMGWTILTNDVIWWIPFGIILWNAARAAQSAAHLLEITPPIRPLNPVNSVLSQKGATLAELSRHSPVLLVFLRHAGCTFCREALSDLARDRQAIQANGTQIALVHMGDEEPTELLKKQGLADLHCFRDPSCTMYETFGLGLGTFRQLLGPAVWWRGLRAFLRGHGVGPLQGNGFRMPGVFLIQNGVIVRAYRHDTAADRPDYVSLSQPFEHTVNQASSEQAEEDHAVASL